MASVSGAQSSRTLLDIIPAYSKSKSAVDVGSIRLKSLVGVSGLQSNTSRFPKLEECAHFHYDHLDLQPVQLSIVSEDAAKGEDDFTVRVTSGSECWQIRRTFDHFSKLDDQLHRCVFDRKFSELIPLSQRSSKSYADVQDLLDKYVRRLSFIWSGCSMSCGPVLSWFELDNRGRRIVASGHGINTPAVAAAFATTPYTASASDELSFQVGDMISVIDMPPAEESSWWRGKRGFVVGFFPSNCVAVITDKIPTEITLAEPSKPVLRKHGKLIAFFRAFILSRPSRRRLKQTGILKERVFGCDLSEHLLNTGRDVPLVLKCCAEFIEAHGIVDGIYRLSGVTSNIQRLRSIFDEDRVPVLEEDSGMKQDVHGVASLLKMYFRELPNPLCTYQLYDEFVAAVQSPNDQRLQNMQKVVQKLPPPHYRTLECLMAHLGKVCGHSGGTGMTARNVAIVWAPNLLRCRSLDQGVAALQGVGVQAVVTEFLILYAPLIFNTHEGDRIHLRPKSLAVSSPTKLLTLEEAMARGQHSPVTCAPEVAAEETDGRPSFHTVIDLPRKRQPLNWRTIFTPRRNQPKSPHRFKRKTIIKSAELLSSSLNGDRYGVHLSSCPSTVNHSRSVSHDSYFDNNVEHKSTSSLIETQQEGLSLSLDLSELQMNFELEESEMRIFSEDETNQLFSSGASIAIGVLENDMNLEKRFSTQNLRFIDSYSPDPMDSPSEDIHTPGYQPLLTTPGSYENLRVSACFDSASSKKSDASPFAYEKLVASPGNVNDVTVQRMENELYEPCTPRSGSVANVYEKMDLEHDIYEPVAAVPMSPKAGKSHREAGGIAKVMQSYHDSNNIYEDIRCASADIYEQVSNFRNSVNEVNTLANARLSDLEPCVGETQSRSLESVFQPTTSRTIDTFQVATSHSPSSTLSTTDQALYEENQLVQLSMTASLDKSVGSHGASERNYVPDTTDQYESDEISKAHYQNINLSLHRTPSPEEKGEELGVFSELTKCEDEPNVNDILVCDSNLSVDILGKTCEDNNRSRNSDDVMGSVEIATESGASQVKGCAVVSEVLKRDWVGRTKDPAQTNPPATESQLGNNSDFGKAEKLTKFVEPTEQGVNFSELESGTGGNPSNLVEQTDDGVNFAGLGSSVSVNLPKFVEQTDDGVYFGSMGVGADGARSKLKLSVGNLNTDDLSHSTESDLERRERIERYKEERRNFFRNKYKTDSLNNNEERDDELIRRYKAKTKNLRTMDFSPSDDGDDFDPKRSPSKMTVSISYSPTKAKAPVDLNDLTQQCAPEVSDPRLAGDKPA